MAAANVAAALVYGCPPRRLVWGIRSRPAAWFLFRRVQRANVPGFEQLDCNSASVMISKNRARSASEGQNRPIARRNGRAGQ